MKKISRVEFSALAFRKNLRERHENTKALLDLEVGEGLVILNDEWKMKSSPAGVASNYKRFATYNVGRLADESGWAVLRTM